MSDPYRWAGRRVTQAHALVATWLPLPCTLCGKQVDRGETFVTAHKIPRWERPDLTWTPSNWGADHVRCSQRSAQREVIRKAKAEGAAEERERLGVAGGPQGSPYGAEHHVTEGSARPRLLDSSGRVFPTTTDAKESPQLPAHTQVSHAEPLEIRQALGWANHVHSAPSWLKPYLDLPKDASPPLAMTPVHEEATGSYGPEAIEWVEEHLPDVTVLRWWQKLAIVRQLEHREDGSLCWRVIVESGPRRIGKSVRLRGMALWRLAVGPSLFPETQLAIHTGMDRQIVKEIHRKAWTWARAEKGWDVRTGAGMEEVSCGDHRWLVKSMDTVYGFDTTLGYVDEGWAVSPDAVDEGLEPSTLERLSAQLVLTSTAHRRATSLMRRRIADALAGEDGETLLLLWGARPQDDPADPETWRAASPYWSKDRARMMSSKYAKALSGEQDPELDDPDPMAGFASQYLNRWRLNDRSKAKGDEVVPREVWEALRVDRPSTPPEVAAIESWEGVSLALGWRTADRAVVAVTDHPDLESAVTALRLSGFRGRLTVGSSLKDDPALRGLRTQTGEGRTGAAAAELRRLLAEEGIWHTGEQHLTDQVLAIRTVPGADGPRMASRGRADAVKAATWVAREARTKRPSTFKVLLPSS